MSKRSASISAKACSRLRRARPGSGATARKICVDCVSYERQSRLASAWKRLKNCSGLMPVRTTIARDSLPHLDWNPSKRRSGNSKRSGHRSKNWRTAAQKAAMSLAQSWSRSVFRHDSHAFSVSPSVGNTVYFGPSRFAESHCGSSHLAERVSAPTSGYVIVCTYFSSITPKASPQLSPHVRRDGQKRHPI